MTLGHINGNLVHLLPFMIKNTQGIEQNKLKTCLGDEMIPVKISVLEHTTFNCYFTKKKIQNVVCLYKQTVALIFP